MLVTLILVAIVLFLVYYLWTWNFNYWEVRGIPGPKPSLLYGNTKSFFFSSESYCLEVEEIYNNYKDKGVPLVGYFAGRTPHLLVMDPHTTKEVMTRNFSSFYDNEASDMMTLKSDTVLGRNPFFQKGPNWKSTRQSLVSGFTNNRIKTYYPIMLRVCKDLNQYIDRVCKKSPRVDIDDLAGRFAAELVSDLIFGVNANALSEEESAVLENSKRFIDTMAKLSTFFLWTGLLPLLKRFYKFQIMEKGERDFFQGLLKNSLKYRGRGQKRPDYLQFLVGLMDKGMNESEIFSHSILFLLDGYDTCSVAMTIALQDLARNQDVQDRLRAEINDVMEANGGEMPVSELLEMPYLNAVVNETIRLRPPFSMIIRQCTKDFELNHPEHEQAIKVPKGTPVMIHVAAIHRDPRHYDRPMEYDPERFMLNDLKTMHHEAKLMNFGNGPRTCLGMNFGLASTKLMVWNVIRNYKITQDLEHEKNIMASPSHFFGYPSKPISLIMTRLE